MSPRAGRIMCSSSKRRVYLCFLSQVVVLPLSHLSPAPRRAFPFSLFSFFFLVLLLPSPIARQQCLILPSFLFAQLEPPVCAIFAPFRYEMALDQDAENPGFMVTVLVGRQQQNEAGQLQLWSNSAQAWQTISASLFPEEAVSVTCPKRTVRTSINRLLAVSQRIDLDLAEPGQAVVSITKALAKTPRILPAPLGTSFTRGYLVCSRNLYDHTT